MASLFISKQVRDASSWQKADSWLPQSRGLQTIFGLQFW